jgi:hypothetical protein
MPEEQPLLHFTLNLPALERLLGGSDPRLQVELTQQVCEQFAKKHLKTILNDETWRKASAAWSKELNAAIDEQLALFAKNESIDSRIPWGPRNRLEEHAAKLVASAVERMVQGVIHDQEKVFRRRLSDALNSMLTVTLPQMVRDQVPAVAKDVVRQECAIALNELVQEEINRRLEALRQRGEWEATK